MIGEEDPWVLGGDRSCLPHLRRLYHDEVRGLRERRGGGVHKLIPTIKQKISYTNTGLRTKSFHFFPRSRFTLFL